MSVEMTARQRNCRVCEGWGCSRCADEPGEQGLSGDEKELLQLRDRVRELEQRCEALRAALERQRRWAQVQVQVGVAGAQAARDDAQRVLEGR